MWKALFKYKASDLRSDNQVPSGNISVQSIPSAHEYKTNRSRAGRLRRQEKGQPECFIYCTIGHPLMYNRKCQCALASLSWIAARHI